MTNLEALVSITQTYLKSRGFDETKPSAEVIAMNVETVATALFPNIERLSLSLAVIELARRYEVKLPVW